MKLQQVLGKLQIYKLATRFLHGLPPELAQIATIRALGLGLGPTSSLSTPELSAEISFDGGALYFPNCVGLAAGFDKNANVPDALIRAGFGFVECGTVTPMPQKGNPKPRLFRLPEDEAVINRMGFNNSGLESFSKHLKNAQSRCSNAVIGINIGANKDSSDRMADYVIGLNKLWGLGAYFTVNISSPNTPGLRSLQSKDHLNVLLAQIAEIRGNLKKNSGKNYPIFVKIAPDLNELEIEDTVNAAIEHGLEGLVISNTTLQRGDLISSSAHESGGLSGAPMFEISIKALRTAGAVSQGRLTLIGVGGVSSGQQAYAKIRAGASLVQLYTALVYKGPRLVDEIRRDLVKRLRADGFKHISEAVGIDVNSKPFKPLDAKKNQQVPPKAYRMAINQNF